MRIILLLALLLVPAGVNAEVTTVTQNDLVVTWYPVQEGITHFAYNISVQNLQDASRDIDISTLISDTSFDISQLKNVKFHEWKNVPSTISAPIYENQSYAYTYVDNATGGDLTETRWRMAQTGTAAETIYTLQWKPSKMQSFERTASVYKERMGLMNVPKYESKEKDGTGNGTKWFRLEFDAPIQKLANGWGSVGKVAFEIDGYEYHPWWGNGSSWDKRRPILFSGTAEANYTMNLTFDSTGSDFMDNGSDIRIVSSESGTEIDLDRVNTTNFNTSSTTIWFRFNESGNVMSGNINSTYYLYYGNPSAGAAPDDESNVYLFYDDFEDGDISDWSCGGTCAITADSSIAMVDYSLKIDDTGGLSGNIANAYPSTFSNYPTNLKLEMDVYRPSNNIFLQTKFNSGGTSGTTEFYDISGGTADSPPNFIRGYEGSTSIDYSNGAYTITFGEFRKFKYAYIFDDKIQHRWDNDYYLGNVTRTGTPSTVNAMTFRSGCSSCTGIYGYLDNIRISKYISPEPTTSLGDEETQTVNITLENSTYAPGYGDVNDTFNFTIDISNPEGGSVNATLFINNASVGSDTVSANSTASVLWTATASGDYTYHWEAAGTNDSSDAVGRYPESGEATGPVVYGPSYNRSINVPGGVNRLMCTAIWTGLYNVSGVTVALTDSNGTLYQEFDSSTTTRKKIIESVIPLPGLANYNITRYEGITKMSIASPAQGTWTFKVMDTNLTSFETAVDIS